MPIYEYQCVKSGNKTEIILPLSFSDKQILLCPEHYDVGMLIENNIYEEYNKRLEEPLEGSLHCAEKVVSVPSPPSIGKPIYIFKNKKTGETRTLYKETDRFKPPKGFVVEEVKGQTERLKFEKELNQKQQVENEIVSYQREQMKNATQENRHDDLNANMSKLDNQSQNLLKAAMKRSKKKEFRKKKSEVRIPINHQNKSNLTHG